MNYLFVGGPLDGELREVEDGCLRVESPYPANYKNKIAVYKQMEVFVHKVLAHESADGEMTGADVIVFALSTMTVTDVLMSLILGYHDHVDLMHKVKMYLKAD